MVKISACVMTYNEEKDIEVCLNSLLWTNEIIVLDSFSKDKTLEIAKKYTDKIYQVLVCFNLYVQVDKILIDIFRLLTFDR